MEEQFNMLVSVKNINELAKTVIEMTNNFSNEELKLRDEFDALKDIYQLFTEEREKLKLSEKALLVETYDEERFVCYFYLLNVIYLFSDQDLWDIDIYMRKFDKIINKLSDGLEYTTFDRGTNFLNNVLNSIRYYRDKEAYINTNMERTLNSIQETQEAFEREYSEQYEYIEEFRRLEKVSCLRKEMYYILMVYLRLVYAMVIVYKTPELEEFKEQLIKEVKDAYHQKKFLTKFSSSI